MNKQQLANKIWESANKMRSKIEANEYKDYILGFIFYKFLSDREEKYLRGQDWDKEYMQIYLREEYSEELFDEDYTEKDHKEFVETIQKNLGYFMSYDHLFSTWLDKGSDFNVSDVRDALSAFSRLINNSHKKVFDGVFDTLQTGLSKLGDSSNSQTRAISDLIHLIKDIPMDGKQDYDVLGFIYEYLISNFAANAGKKAGEFYTPHEVSLLMSEIVADHLKDRSEIKIYDPTSGSGSLLINIGKSVARHMGDSDRIKYYAQELKENTYNLTRMNLVMRGILPDNIVTRNGDTLEEDWPYFDESDPIGTYEPLYVDAVVSNPPYSQNWNPADKESDPRYSRYGLAPKSKADYAFLLHDLFHIKADGIMTIVLPHGVLFRGGEEGEIRKNLIENNNIDTIIGLPANIFFGTGIPTIIMVLKQKRENTDILIVDASKGFEKVGKNNKLRASDIKRIVDAVVNRVDIEKFSKVVSRETVRENDYNLNIPRYVDSSEKPESWDIYASMFGGIPKSELDDLNEYWEAFPTLKDEIFEYINNEYVELKTDDVKKVIKNHPDVQKFVDEYNGAFGNFADYLYDELKKSMEGANISKEESVLSNDIFKRLKDIPLIDAYEAYQILDDSWSSISVDLEIIQTEGFESARQVDPNMVVKKKDGKETEGQDGYLGHILPFELVQKVLLVRELDELNLNKKRFDEIHSLYEEYIDMLSEDDKQNLLNNDNTAFVSKAIANETKSVLADVTSPEIRALEEYISLTKKKEKTDFVNEHNEVDWDVLEMGKSGTFNKSSITKRVNELKSKKEFPHESREYIVVSVSRLIEEEKQLKKTIEEKTEKLHNKTKETIESLSDEEIYSLLYRKWVFPLVDSILDLPNKTIDSFVSSLKKLAQKYELTMSEVESQIEETEKELCTMLDMLTGSDFDMQGLSEFKKMLGGV